MCLLLRCFEALVVQEDRCACTCFKATGGDELIEWRHTVAVGSSIIIIHPFHYFMFYDFIIFLVYIFLHIVTFRSLKVITVPGMYCALITEMGSNIVGVACKK